jgi:hypothetical protein
MGRANASINKKTEARANRAIALYTSPACHAASLQGEHTVHTLTHTPCTRPRAALTLVSSFLVWPFAKVFLDHLLPFRALGQLAENYVIDLKDPY